MTDHKYIVDTPSTNALLWEMMMETSLPEGFVVHTDFQSAGKGQSGNTWESQAERNLLFSMLLYPTNIAMDELFLISQLVSVGIKKTLDQYSTGITIKWPNDIYWNDKKLAGILIENSLQGKQLKAVVVGIGLNVNQKEFVSNAPNPVSLYHINRRLLNRTDLLQKIRSNILDVYTQLNAQKIRAEYAYALYRKDGFHLYKAGVETFKAKICEVHPDGQLELKTEAGERRGYYFKEVQFVV